MSNAVLKEHIFTYTTPAAVMKFVTNVSQIVNSSDQRLCFTYTKAPLVLRPISKKLASHTSLRSICQDSTWWPWSKFIIEFVICRYFQVIFNHIFHDISPFCFLLQL